MLPQSRIALLIAWLSLPALLVAQTTYYWTGQAVINSSALASDTGNWSGGTVPASDASAATGSTLVFGNTNGGSNGSIDIIYDGGFDALGITFTTPRPEYSFFVSGSIGIGSNGITLNGNPNVFVWNSTLHLLASQQTWNLGGSSALYLYGSLSDGEGSSQLVKAGSGSLVLNSDMSTFSGGLTISAGTLFLGGSSAMEGSAIVSGPVGTGTLTLADNTMLRSNTFADVTLHNALFLGNNVTIGYEQEHNGYSFKGPVTFLSSGNVTLRLGAENAVFFAGAIQDAASGPTALTIAKATTAVGESLGTETDHHFPVAVLTANADSPNTYSGGTTADGAGIIFYTPSSIPATGNITALNSGYVGTGYNGGMTQLLSHIPAGSRPAFNGSLGFDTDPDNSEGPTIFYDNVDLSAFTPDTGSPDALTFRGLGSQTSAILAGNITPPTGGNYIFGGGAGKLYVQSDLTAATGVRVHTTFGYDPLTVYFQGHNSFTGSVLSDHSIVIFDSAGALPTGVSFGLDANAYVGHTELTDLTPNQFVARLNPTGYNSNSVLGFDTTSSNLPEGRTIFDPLNLSALNDIFIGTATHVHFNNTITAPSSGKLSVTGVAGGWLTLDSALLAANLTSLNVGNTGSEFVRRGYVELGESSGSSTFTGGTTLNSGYLLFGSSSTAGASAGTVASGPLGTGTLTFSGTEYTFAPALVPTSDGLTLHNNIAFAAGSAAQFGIYQTHDSENPASRLQDYKNNGLTLAGTLSGTPDTVLFAGNGTFTLAGDNRNLTTSEFDIGSGFSQGTPLVVAATNTALGSTSSMICLGAGADIQFNTAAPVIGSIMGGDTFGFDSNNRSFVALQDGSTLTIHQSQNGILYANVGGVPASYSNSATTDTTANLVKDGTGKLTLAGYNTYANTTINAGTLIAANSHALGNGTVTLNGGQLGLKPGVTVANNIVFGLAGGTLGGTGTFSSNLTIGTNVLLAPGNSPGTMTFTNGLSFASGGVYSIDIADLYGTAGTDYDTLSITGGTLNISATAGSEFNIRLNSLSSLSALGQLTTSPGTGSLVIASSASAITGFSSNAFLIDASNFTTNLPNVAFNLSLSGDSKQLLLNFTAVPEPSTYALLGLGLLTIAATLRRRPSPQR